jgi:ion channel-forming bestrophin family protein
MWIEKKRSWIEMVALGGFALPHIWMRTLTVTAISLCVTVLYEQVPQLHYSLTTAPFTIVGLPLGIFLGFRNNTAYDRFWEGRKLWGALVNTTRSLTRQIITLIEPPSGPNDESRAFERDVVRMVVAYVHALRLHLRDLPARDTLEKILSKEEVDRVADDENVPLALLQRIGERFVEARRKEWIDVMHVNIIEGSLTSLTDIQGACERIKSTPIPYSYTVLMHRIVAGYCVLLPFGLMETIKWATPVVVLAISYCFFGMDAIGDEIEQPFGFDTNDLPLDSISIAIERNLRARIADPLPEKLKAKRGVLT